MSKQASVSSKSLTKTSAKTSTKSGKAPTKSESSAAKADKTSTKTAKKSMAGSGMPQKPTSAYMLFQREKFLTIMKPGITFPMASKELAAQYKALSEDAKKQYEDAAAKDKERYAREMNKVDPAVKEAHNRAEEEKKAERFERKYKKQLKEDKLTYKMPQRPPTAYNSFVKSMRKTMGADEQAPDFLKRMAAAWKELDAAKKEGFQKKYVAAKEKHANQMKRWNEKMVKDGNGNIAIRLTSTSKSSADSKIRHLKEVAKRKQEADANRLKAEEQKEKAKRNKLTVMDREKRVAERSSTKRKKSVGKAVPRKNGRPAPKAK